MSRASMFLRVVDIVGNLMPVSCSNFAIVSGPMKSDQL